jgi:RimJ/RimL family protein N-acetyltransferase
MTWVPHQVTKTVADFLQALLQRQRDGAEYAWVIEEQTRARPIGMISACIREHKAEIGYVLARRCWGLGYMTQAVSVVTDWLLAQPEIYRVSAVCDTENPGSARVLEKSGFEREGMLRRWIIHPNCPGGPRDCYMYGKAR